ncbi:partial Alpha-amylase 1, partial [Burkholderiales bacterium]
GPAETVLDDSDCDGCDEVCLRSDELQAVLKLDAHAALCEFDHRALFHNFGDTLTQREEFYYHKLGAVQAGVGPGEGIASAHDRVAFRHEVCLADTTPDARPRRLFLDQWTCPDGHAHWPEYALAQAGSAGQELVLAARMGQGEVAKTYRLAADVLEVSWRLRNFGGGVFCTEINLALPSCDGYSGRYILENGEIPCGFGQHLELAAFGALTLDDRELRGGLRLEASPRGQLQAAPHDTVSQSEAGFEKIMQAACLRVSWPVPLTDLTLTLRLQVFLDDPH